MLKFFYIKRYIAISAIYLFNNFICFSCEVEKASILGKQEDSNSPVNKGLFNICVSIIHQPQEN